MIRLPRSLLARLLWLVLGLVTVVWLASAVATWVDARHELDELLDGHLAQAAALLVAREAGEIEDDHQPVDAPLLHKYAPRVAFQVFHEGRLALRSAQAPALPMAGPDSMGLQGFRTVLIAGESWRVFGARGASRDVQVFVGEQLSSRSAILLAVLRGTLWPLLVALPLLALAVALALYRGLSPLRRLGRELAAREPSALAPVAPRDAPSEMQPMVDALNGLFGRISLLMASERRFTADAAHELRTPIAAIRMQAQVALGEADEAQRRHALQGTLEGCDRAARLVDQLLTLSRLESAGAPTAQAQELGAAVRAVVAQVAPQALERLQTLDLEVQDACTAHADPTLLAVLVRNLVDNASRYTPRGGRIRVGVAPTPAGASLTVEDSGPGLSAADLDRLGERFFRVLGTGQTGSGLGWSIVRRIAATQGASVRAERSAALGGLRVEVLWPVAESGRPGARAPAGEQHPA